MASAAPNEALAAQSIETPATAIKLAQRKIVRLEREIKRQSKLNPSEAVVFSHTDKLGNKFTEYMITHRLSDGQGGYVYDNFWAEEPVTNPKSNRPLQPSISQYMTGMPHKDWKEGDGFTSFQSITRSKGPNPSYELVVAVDGDFSGGITYNLAGPGRTAAISGEVGHLLGSYTDQARSIVFEKNE